MVTPGLGERDLSAIDDAFIPSSENKLNPTAKDTYVHLDPATGLYTPKSTAVLSSKTANDKKTGNPRVVASEERDISSRLGDASKPTYTLSVGIAWDNGESTTMFCFRDAILEYRKNIGRESDKINPITNTRPCYMKTYASIGIPISRYNWLKAQLKSIGINAARGSKDSETNGYVWFNANITKNFSPFVLIRSLNGNLTVMSEGKENIINIMKKAKSNIIGIIGVEITLKRAPDFDTTAQRVVTLSFKAIQPYDITNISSPPLNRTVCFDATEDMITTRLHTLLTTKSTPKSSKLASKVTEADDRNDDADDTPIDL